MNKLWIVVEREFSVKVKKKSFIIMTILMPFLIAALIFVPALLGQMDGNKRSSVAIVDPRGLLPDTLLKNTPDLMFQKMQVKGPTDKFISTCLDDEAPVSYDAVVLVGDSLTEKSPLTIYSSTEVPKEVESYVNDRTTLFLRSQKLKAYRISDIQKLLTDANTTYRAKTIRLDKEGKETMSSSEIAGIVGLVLSLFIYTFILSYGGMVMSSVVEEKANRIVEVMVSSVKPWQLMAGKIIGTALVGLFQFVVWGLMVAGLLTIAGTVFGLTEAGGAAAAAMPTGMDMAQVQAMAENPGMEFLQVLQGMPVAEILIVFVLYFIGGYLLFAASFAAIGASVNEQQDTQQFMMPIILIFIFALYAGMFSIENPDGPLAMWCSFIPFTSPVVMMVRIPFQTPLWQIALSLLLLYGTAAAVVWFSAKIYRVGILMYGKKPTFKDMLKWMNYK
jgi:ABC-2 type transport system permease protein